MSKKEEVIVIYRHLKPHRPVISKIYELPSYGGGLAAIGRTNQNWAQHMTNIHKKELCQAYSEFKSAEFHYEICSSEEAKALLSLKALAEADD